MPRGQIQYGFRICKAVYSRLLILIREICPGCRVADQDNHYTVLTGTYAIQSVLKMTTVTIKVQKNATLSMVKTRRQNKEVVNKISTRSCS